MKCFSHPDKELVTHLSNVKQMGLDTFRKKENINLELPSHIVNKALTTMLYYHDIGKSTPYFQEYLQCAIEGKKYSGSETLRQHSLVSAVYAGYKTYLGTESDETSKLLAMIVFCTILKHHGNFEDIKYMVSIKKTRWPDIKELWTNLNFEAIGEKEPLDYNEAETFIKDLAFEIEDINIPITSYFIMNFFFSILTYADKNEAIFGKLKEPLEFNPTLANIVDNYKTIKFKNNLKNDTKLNHVRDEIYTNCQSFTLNQPILSINVPTGSGKTVTAINFALKLLAQNRSLKKIIYALPFTSIIDQTEELLRDIFLASNLDPDNYISVHHHLAQAAIKINENHMTGDSAQFIIENWDSLFILTTFWQFFHSLISGRNNQLRKFHNFANSIIILDEIQTLPYEYWLTANQLLKKLTTTLNCKIVLLTATMPLIFDEEDNEIYPIIKKDKIEPHLHVFSRYKISIINELQPMQIEKLKEIAIEHIQQEQEKSFLFVFNTIKSSLEFFNFLKEHVDHENLIYISSNIIPVDRKEKIERIKKTDKRKIVVSTQIIEAGVDIDLDVVYRDFAPLDSIIQSAGRCNRNNRNTKGVVHVYKLVDCNNRFYSNYIYSVVPLDSTNEILKGITECDETELMLLVNAYYQKVKLKMSTDKSRSIIENIENLEYSKIDEQFKLIKESIPDVLVFIEKDDNASNILNQFYQILEIDDKWEKKSSFLEIKRDFYSHTISLKLTKDNLNNLKDFKEIGNFRLITKDMVNTYYKNDIGYNYEFENFF